MVGACRHRRFRQFQAVVTGGAKQLAGAEPGACRGNVTVVTAEMEARSIHGQRHIEVVVDDQRYAARGTQGLQYAGLGEP